MIEKFFGGCQSEKNKINEIIDAVNGLNEGGGDEISFSSKNLTIGTFANHDDWFKYSDVDYKNYQIVETTINNTHIVQGFITCDIINVTENTAFIVDLSNYRVLDSNIMIPAIKQTGDTVSPIVCYFITNNNRFTVENVNIGDTVTVFTNFTCMED